MSNSRLIHFTNSTRFKWHSRVGMQRHCCTFQGSHKPMKVDLWLYHIALPKCISSLLTYSHRIHVHRVPRLQGQSCQEQAEQLLFFRRDFTFWVHDIWYWQPNSMIFERNAWVNSNSGNRYYIAKVRSPMIKGIQRYVCFSFISGSS